VSRGGNPLPEIDWSMNGKSKLPPVSTQTIVYTIESTFDLILQREHHSKPLQCQTSNKVGALKKQVSFNVSCKFFVVLLIFSKPMKPSFVKGVILWTKKN
jgi:hypothetical protein